MNLIRSELTIALNDLIATCLEAASLYESAANSAVRPEVAEGFRALARNRKAAAEKLGDSVIRLGDFPVGDPDDEKILVEKAWTKFRALLAPDTDAELLAKCASREEKILAAAEAVLDAGPGDNARRIAAGLKEDSAARAEAQDS